MNKTLPEAIENIKLDRRIIDRFLMKHSDYMLCPKCKGTASKCRKCKGMLVIRK